MIIYIYINILYITAYIYIYMYIMPSNEHNIYPPKAFWKMIFLSKGGIMWDMLALCLYIYILCTMESDFMDIFIAELLAADMFLKTWSVLGIRSISPKFRPWIPNYQRGGLAKFPYQPIFSKNNSPNVTLHSFTQCNKMYQKCNKCTRCIQMYQKSMTPFTIWVITNINWKVFDRNSCKWIANFFWSVLWDCACSESTKMGWGYS